MNELGWMELKVSMARYAEVKLCFYFECMWYPLIKKSNCTVFIVTLCSLVLFVQGSQAREMIIMNAYAE